jgi:hypothetical protein
VDSPWAILEKTSIFLQPSGFQCAIPQKWVDWYEQSHDNLHLTAKELDRVGHGAGEWDDEFGRVCNALFPFDRGAAHVGGTAWQHGGGYGNLQVRVYDLEGTADVIEQDIDTKGQAAIERSLGFPVKTQRGLEDGWRQRIFSFDRFYHDYGATAYADIRLKAFDDRTIAFVFMHTDRQEYKKTITDMLHSAKLSKKE